MISRGGPGRRRHSYTDEVYALVRGEVDAIYVKDVRGAEVANLLGAVVVADIVFYPDPFVRVSNCAPRPLTISRETGWSEQWIRRAYGLQVHLHLTAGLEEWIVNFDRFKSFLAEKGFIPNDFDTRAWIDPAPLEAVRRELAGRKAA